MRSRVLAAIAAVAITGGTVAALSITDEQGSPVEVSTVAGPLPEFGVKFTLRSCGQRLSGSTRVGGKGVLFVMEGGKWWVYQSKLLSTVEPGADIQPPYFTGYFLPGQHFKQEYAPTSKGGKYQMWFASDLCPAAEAGKYRGDAAVATITVLPKA